MPLPRLRWKRIPLRSTAETSPPGVPVPPPFLAYGLSAANRTVPTQRPTATRNTGEALSSSSKPDARVDAALRM